MAGPACLPAASAHVGMAAGRQSKTQIYSIWPDGYQQAGRWAGKQASRRQTVVPLEQTGSRVEPGWQPQVPRCQQQAHRTGACWRQPAQALHMT